MRLPIPRFTVGRLMMAVLVISLATWAIVEVGFKAPARHHAARLIGHHEIRAGSWHFLADSNRDRPDRSEECLRLARWHEARVREIREAEVPRDRRWWEEGERTTRREQAFFGEIGGTGMAPVSYGSL